MISSEKQVKTMKATLRRDSNVQERGTMPNSLQGACAGGLVN